MHPSVFLVKTIFIITVKKLIRSWALRGVVAASAVLLWVWPQSLFLTFALFAFVAASGIVREETEAHTLKSLVTRPLRREEIIAAKLGALCTVNALVAAFAAGASGYVHGNFGLTSPPFLVMFANVIFIPAFAAALSLRFSGNRNAVNGFLLFFLSPLIYYLGLNAMEPKAFLSDAIAMIAGAANPETLFSAFSSHPAIPAAMVLVYTAAYVGMTLRWFKKVEIHAL